MSIHANDRQRACAIILGAIGWAVLFGVLMCTPSVTPIEPEPRPWVDEDIKLLPFKSKEPEGHIDEVGPGWAYTEEDR